MSGDKSIRATETTAPVVGIPNASLPVEAAAGGTLFCHQSAGSLGPIGTFALSTRNARKLAGNARDAILGMERNPPVRSGGKLGAGMIPTFAATGSSGLTWIQSGAETGAYRFPMRSRKSRKSRKSRRSRRTPAGRDVFKKKGLEKPNEEILIQVGSTPAEGAAHCFSYPNVLFHPIILLV